MNKIKNVVDAYKVRNPQMTNQDIAVKLFPENKPKRAREKLSRWLNGHEVEVIKLKHIRRMCEVLECKADELI